MGNAPGETDNGTGGDSTEGGHLIKAIQGARFQIGNNRGRINGWVTASAIFGRCVSVED